MGCGEGRGMNVSTGCGAEGREHGHARTMEGKRMGAHARETTTKSSWHLQ